MPLYEYRCQECRRRSTVFVRSMSSTVEPSCQHCGSENMRRLISRVIVHKSWGSSLDWAPDSDFPQGLDQEDPKQMAQWMRRMQHEMGEEVTPEFEEMVGEMESGDGDFDDDQNDDDD